MSSNEQWAKALTVILLVLAIVYMTSSLRKGIVRLRKNGNMLIDHDGWILTLADDALWFARFSADWRGRYGSSWAVGYKRTHIWFYQPKGAAKHGDGTGI